MATIEVDASEIRVNPGYAGFLEFAAVVGLDLEPFQRKIARAALDGHELLVLLPRGNGKSRLIGTLAVHHLLTTSRPAVYLAAASRDQARVVFEYARDVAMHPGLRERITVRHLELRVADGFLRVLASDAPMLHGLTPSLAVCDEMQAFKDDSVYLALRTAVHKRPGAQMWTISTAGQGQDSALGRLRARALAQSDVSTRGGLTVSRGRALTMLEWRAPEEHGLDGRAARMANPASWLLAESLRDQRQAVPELAYRRFHLNQWVEKTGSWLPAGMWQQCVGEPRFEDGESIVIGVDIGGERSASAVVWINDALNVGVAIFHGDRGVLECKATIEDLAARYRVRACAYDPWRAAQLAQELEARRVRCVVFPQSDSRMCPASERLYRAVVERRLVLPDDRELHEHAAAAVARHSRRGWRLEKAHDSAPIDALIALCMALERAEAKKPPEPRLIGWL